MGPKLSLPFSSSSPSSPSSSPFSQSDFSPLSLKECSAAASPHKVRRFAAIAHGHRRIPQLSPLFPALSRLPLDPHSQEAAPLLSQIRRTAVGQPGRHRRRLLGPPLASHAHRSTHAAPRCPQPCTAALRNRRTAVGQPGPPPPPLSHDHLYFQRLAPLLLFSFRQQQDHVAAAAATLPFLSSGRATIGKCCRAHTLFPYSSPAAHGYHSRRRSPPLRLHPSKICLSSSHTSLG